MENIHDTFEKQSKIKWIIGILVFIFVISACVVILYVDSIRENEHSVYAQNAPERNKIAAKKPIIIGETDDGQEIKMVVIENIVKDCSQCSEYIQKHNVYYIGKTVSDNSVVYSGKQAKIQTHTSILN